MYQQLITLKSSGAPSHTVEAFYAPIFKELAQIIAGRDDIPVPPVQVHRTLFLVLLNPKCESSMESKVLTDNAMQELIDYSSSFLFCVSLF